MRFFVLVRCVLGVCFLLGFADAAMAANRVALVIGNGDYKDVPSLENPANDASDIAKALTDAGFDVIERTDASREQMADAVRDFTQRIQGADVALFYYAGHGIQMDGENYLLPIDAKITSPADVRFATINLSDVQQEMAGAGRANIIVLDACRNNPFAKKLSGSGRSIGERGLGRMDATGVGSLVVFSTQPNNVALDGAGRNSPFAAALAKHIATPNVEIRRMLSDVRADVLAATDQKQVPWDSSSLVGDVYLSRTVAAEATPTPSASAVAPQPSPAPTESPAASASRQQETAASGDAAECEKLAALEPLFSSPDQIKALRKSRDWNRAVIVCKAASEADANSARLRFLLGASYFHQKDYLNARQQYTIAADAGDADAQGALGYLFLNGMGVLKDNYRALDYFSKAAAAGKARSIANLGAMYGNGLAVPRDDAKALALYEKAIELGYPFALDNAGVMYFNGQGVPKDYAAAEQYFLQAAELSDGYAMKFLAIMYEHGLVGPADPAKGAQLRVRAEEEDPDSTTPQVTFVKPSIPLTRHAYTGRRIVRYRWSAAGCCPRYMLVCLTLNWCN